MDSELAEIKARILEIRDSLSEPLKDFLNKEINKTEAYFKDNEPGLEIKKIFFKNCLKYAKEYAEKCKKIEKDFPFRWSKLLTTDNKLFSIFLYKLHSVCVLDDPSSEINKIKGEIYREARDILEKLLSIDFHQSYRYAVQDSIKKSILELLILLLDKKEGAKFSDEYRGFFENVSLLISKNSVDLNYCVEQINKIETPACFYPKGFLNIRRKIFAVIFSIDRSIIDKNLLAEIGGIAKSGFSGHPALINFINCFIFELINYKDYFYASADENLNKRFDLGMVLIYQALNRKGTEEIISHSQKNLVNRFIKRPPISTVDGQLSKFKQDYHDKTGKNFPEEALSEGQVSLGEQVHELPVYFDILEINRSSKAVKRAFNIALRTYDKLESSEDRQTKTMPIETVNKFKAKGIGLWKAAKKSMEKGVEKLTDFIDEASNKAIEVVEMGQEVAGSAMDSVKDRLKDTVSNFKLPASIKEPFLGLAEDDEKNKELIEEKLRSLRAKLEDMALQLANIELFLKNSIDQERLSSMVISDDKKSIDLDRSSDMILSDAEEYSDLENQSEVIRSNIDNVYSEGINKSKLEIEKTIQLNSWLKDKNFSLMELIKAFFGQGCFYVNLDKLKNRLNDQIDFDSEKDFFLKASFSSLLRYGVIRWPWRNKEDFAINWAEQVILLKAKDCIEKTTHKALNKANFLLELIKLHGEVFYRLDERDFFSDLYRATNKAGINYFPEIASLREKINRHIGFGSKVNSPADYKVSLDDRRGFFNDRNKEPEPSGQPSANFGVTQNTF